MKKKRNILFRSSKKICPREERKKALYRHHMRPLQKQNRGVVKSYPEWTTAHCLTEI
jgi:hypothetical protein